MLHDTYGSINCYFQVEDINTINTSAAQQYLTSAIEILKEQSDERFLPDAKARLHGIVHRWLSLMSTRCLQWRRFLSFS